MLTKVCKTLLNQTLLQASYNQNKSRISVTDSSGLTAQMAEWYGSSALGVVYLCFIPSQVKPVTLKLVFTASLLDAQGTMWRASRQVYLLCRWERHLAGFSHLGVMDRWLATPKRARIGH